MPWVVPYLVRWLRHPEAAIADLRNPVAGALYGTFPGGLLVLAVGVATVGPSLGAPDAVTATVAVLATIGIVLAFAVSVVFAYLLFAAPQIGPQTANGAWFIPPVVNIVAPLALAPLVSHVSPGDAATLIVAGYAFLGMGLLLFVLVASLMYDRLVFHPLPAAPLAPSLWIGLGPVGVGVLGILRLAQVGAPLWGSAAGAVSAFSNIGAALLWGFGLWWLAAAVTSPRGLPARRTAALQRRAGGRSRSRSGHTPRPRWHWREPGNPGSWRSRRWRSSCCSPSSGWS